MFTIVCLIGSTKFESTFRKLEEELSLAGYLVFFTTCLYSVWGATFMWCAK